LLILFTLGENMVQGYHIDGTTGHVVCDATGSSECLEGCKLLTVVENDGKKVYWVVPLNKPLEYPHPKRIWNFDEKPVFPDSPRLQTIGAPPIAAGRAPIWTVGV
jgi:hypothetical protein